MSSDSTGQLQRVGHCLYRSQKSRIYYAILKRGGKQIKRSLRHVFCSNAIEAGVDFKTIAAWLGHKDGGLLVARTYGHLRDEHSTLMAQRMTFGCGDE